MINYLLDRLRERSTWIAIFAMSGAFLGHYFAPEQQRAIELLAFALLGGGHVLSKECK